MKKINVLKENKDFSRIVKHSNPIKYKGFLLYIEEGTTDVYKFGISVSKKLGNAVVRNKIKRQVRSIIDKKHYKNNFNCIIIIRKSYLDLNYHDNEEHLLYILNKNNLIEKGENYEEKN